MHALIGEIYDCALSTEQWQVTLPKIARSIGAHAITFQFQRSDSPRSEMICSIGLDQNWREDYLTNWDSRNAWRVKALLQLSRLPERQRYFANHVSRLVSPEDVYRSDVFNCSLKHMDLYDCIGIPLNAGYQSFWISAFCGKGKRLFTDEDLINANILAPHLARSAYIADCLVKRTQFFDNGKLTNNMPLILTTNRLELLKANAQAEDVILSGHVAALIGKKDYEKVDFRSANLQTILLEKIRSYEKYVLPHNSYSSIYACDLPDGYRISVYPVDSFDNQISNTRLRSEYIIAFEPIHSPAIDVAALQLEHGLTETEVSVASMMAAGLRPGDIAAERDVKVSTIRWHIKQIYMKLGVNNQIDLFRKIMTSQS